MVPWVGDFAPLSTIWTSETDYLMDNRMHKVSKCGWKSPRDTGKRDTRWRDTGRRKSEGPSYISLLPPCLACPCAQSPYALAYFVSPNEGLVVAHGTSGPTKKSRTSLFTNKTCLLKFYAGGTRLELILFHECGTSRTEDVLFGFGVSRFYGLEKQNYTFCTFYNSFRMKF